MLWLCADFKLFTWKSVLLFLGSLEMDSPSQPVNNHHVHSHATVESKSVPREWLPVVFCFSPLTCFVCLSTERKYSTPAHHTTEHVPEKKFKSEALLSTLTSDASKENTPGKTYILSLMSHHIKTCQSQQKDFLKKVNFFRHLTIFCLYLNSYTTFQKFGICNFFFNFFLALLSSTRLHKSKTVILWNFYNLK